MKNWLAVLFLSTACVLAAPPAQKSVTFKWSPDPSQFGGLSTNDYYTNIVFNLYSVTNCTIPTNQWPIVAQWVASTFPSPDGTNWTNSVMIDGATRFYLIQAANQNGGVSPFSSVATWVSAPQVGFQPRVFGP